MTDLIEKELKVLIQYKYHANSDSLPLRYGFTFKPERYETARTITLFDIERTHEDSQYQDRWHVIASFSDQDGNTRKGHFVIGLKNYLVSQSLFENALDSKPYVVTIWSDNFKFSPDKEIELSTTLKEMRQKGYLKVDDLIAMHPEYIMGNIWTHGDLINTLTTIKAKELSKDQIEKLKKDAADQINELSIEAKRRNASTISISKLPNESTNPNKPLILKSVSVEEITNRDGISKKTICLNFGESFKKRKNNWANGFEERLKLCESLVGKAVKTDCSGSFSPNEWFKDIHQSSR